jgi:hypothetical protein
MRYRKSTQRRSLHACGSPLRTTGALVAVLAILQSPAVFAQPAFPGALGFGAKATGRRGGNVLIVSNLDTSGPGSLQWAVSQSGPRIVVFRVSGVINGNVHIPHGDLTIAGQTAPGAGITIRGRLTSEYDDNFGNLIVRHLRVRPPQCGSGCDAEQYDAIQFSRGSVMILDHVSAAQAADER